MRFFDSSSLSEVSPTLLPITEVKIMSKDGSSLLDPKDQMGTEVSPQNEGMQVPKEGRNAEKQHNKSLLQVTSLEIFSSKDYYASESRSTC